MGKQSLLLFQSKKNCPELAHSPPSKRPGLHCLNILQSNTTSCDFKAGKQCCVRHAMESKDTSTRNQSQCSVSACTPLGLIIHDCRKNLHRVYCCFYSPDDTLEHMTFILRMKCNYLRSAEETSKAVTMTTCKARLTLLHIFIWEQKLSKEKKAGN